MLRGLDTGFLVALEVIGHAEHATARQTQSEILAAGDRIAIAPQVLAEFMHIVTDPRRFSQPLPMDKARDLARQWWTAREVDRTFPDSAAIQRFLDWLQEFSLGRKRLLDTLLAATYRGAGIESVLTTNKPDFAILGFRCVTPGDPVPENRGID
jgi:predicted nucleic acid-binding protein